MDIEKAFAVNLKKIRKQKDITQNELAQKSGVSIGTISSYESGIKSPSLLIVAKLAEALGVSIDELCGFNKGLINETEKDQSGEYPLVEILKAIFLLIDIGILKTKQDIKSMLYYTYEEGHPFLDVGLDVLEELSPKQNIFLIEDKDICEALCLAQQVKELEKTNLPGVDIYKLVLDGIYEKYKTQVVKEKENGKYFIYDTDCPF